MTPANIRFPPVADVQAPGALFWHKAAMAASVSRGVYRHGKRYRFVVTALDDSPEAFKAALRELDEQVRKFTAATAPEGQRQSYRKRRVPKGE